MSKEAKIGLLTIIAITALILGYKFLKGKNVFSTADRYYVEYDQIDRLSRSAGVFINGFQVGIVGEIYQKPDDNRKLEVVLALDNGTMIPKNTIAEIVSTNMMGGKGIYLRYNEPCDGSNCAQDGDRLQGRLRNFMQSMAGTPDDMKAYMDVANEGMRELVDSLKAQFSGTGQGGNEAVDDIKTIITNLKSTTLKLDRMIGQSANKIDALLNNLSLVTSNIAQKNTEINRIIDNVASISAQIKASNLDVTIKETTETIKSAKASFVKLNTSMDGIDVAVLSLSDVLKKINSKEGTLGLLINDKKLYDEINKTVIDLDLLVKDIRLHPERYRRILSKKKMPYEAPE